MSPTRKRVVITGITGTLGEALARLYRERGDEVVGVTHREDAQSAVCDRLVVCAQRSERDAHALIDLDPDLLLLNAGRIETEVGTGGLPLAQATREIYELNAVFPSLVAIAAAERGADRRLDVVAIGSIADGSPSCFGPVYHASKAALHYFYTGAGPIAHATDPNVRIRLYRPGVIRGPLSWAPVLRLNQRGRAIRARRCENAPVPEVVAGRIAHFSDGDAWVGSDREPLSFKALRWLFALAPDRYYRVQRLGWRRAAASFENGSRASNVQRRKPMKITIVSEVFLPKIDGITNRLRNTIECLVDEGHEVRVIAPQGSVEEYAGASVVRIPGPPFPLYPGLRICLPDPRILWELFRFRPDVVHVVGPACLGIWVLLAARVLRLPIVASYHTDFPRYLKGYGLGGVERVMWPLIRWVHNLARANLAPSTFTRDELERHGIPGVGIWRGGVDTALFDPRRRCIEMRKRMVSDGRLDLPVLLYAGRVAPEKGLDRLLPVLAQLPDCQLAIVGDGPARADLEALFADTPTRFLGFLRGEELARSFASADLFVMPSLTETLGFVVLEAMSSGLPVVAARGGGIPDIVSAGETGALVDPDDAAQFAKAIRELLADADRKRDVAASARRFAEACDWRAETHGLVDHYQRTIELECGRRQARRWRSAIARLSGGGTNA